jgi:Uma2 family endonuclease
MGIPETIDSADGLGPKDWPDTSHLVTEDDEPLDSTFQERQQKLLVDALYASWKGPGATSRFLALSNVGLFHALKGKHVVPDVMVILDVDLLPCKEHKSYFVWEYGRTPDLAIEVVSKEVGGGDGEKLDKYAVIGVPYYVVYDPYGYIGERPLRAFEHHGRSYVELLHPFLLPQLGLGLTTWEGEYAGCRARFLRFTDKDGKLLLTGTERAEQEHSRAEQERLRAERAEAELAELRRQLNHPS